MEGLSSPEAGVGLYLLLFSYLGQADHKRAWRDEVPSASECPGGTEKERGGAHSGLSLLQSKPHTAVRSDALDTGWDLPVTTPACPGQ